jgi:hypothetical protein
MATIDSNVSSISSLLALSVEDVKTVVITAPLLCAAATIDGAALTAQAVIMRSLANNASILIDLHNSATNKDEVKGLNGIIKNYVQSMTSRYADKEYTIKVVKGVATWAKRDLAVLAREALKTDIANLQTAFIAYKSFDLNGFALVQAMPKASEADLKRVKNTMELAIALAKTLNDNESLLVSTDKMADIVAMFNIESTMSVHELNQRQTLTNTLVKAAELLKKDLDAAKNAYKLAVNLLVDALMNKSGLMDIKAAIMRYTPLSLTACNEITASIKLLYDVAKTAAGVGHVFDTSEFKATCVADIALVLMGYKTTVNAMAESAAKLEAVKEEQSAAIETLKSEQTEVLATIKDSVLLADAEQKELDRLADLASDCENAGLSAAYTHYLTMPNGAAKNTYNAQLGRMLSLYDNDDTAKQDKVYTVYDSLGFTDLATLQGGYAKAIEAISTPGKDRLLTDFDTLFNKDTNEAAAKLRQAIHKIMGGIIEGKETNDRNVMICLVQQIARELELADKAAAA